LKLPHTVVLDHDLCRTVILVAVFEKCRIKLVEFFDSEQYHLFCVQIFLRVFFFSFLAKKQEG